MKAEDIIGLPIVNMRDGTVTSIVMDQNLKHVKRILLTQNRFIILDIIVYLSDSAILVKNSRAVKDSSVLNGLGDSQCLINGNIDLLCVETAGQFW